MKIFMFVVASVLCVLGSNSVIMDPLYSAEQSETIEQRAVKWQAICNGLDQQFSVISPEKNAFLAENGYVNFTTEDTICRTDNWYVSSGSQYGFAMSHKGEKQTKVILHKGTNGITTTVDPGNGYTLSVSKTPGSFRGGKGTDDAKACIEELGTALNIE